MDEAKKRLGLNRREAIGLGVATTVAVVTGMEDKSATLRTLSAPDIPPLPDQPSVEEHEIVERPPQPYRMSLENRAKLENRKLALLQQDRFDAHTVAMYSSEQSPEPEKTLLEYTKDQFSSTLRSLTLGDTLLDESKRGSEEMFRYFVDLCVTGQVSAESSWRNEDNDQGAEGYWQITHVACKQICIERGEGDTASCIDPNNLADATDGAARMHDFAYRFISPSVEQIATVQNLHPTEFLFPCLLTCYIYGAPATQKIISWYSNQEAPQNLTGYDYFLDMVQNARHATTPDNTPLFPDFGDHSEDYAFKCLALKEIFDALKESK